MDGLVHYKHTIYIHPHNDRIQSSTESSEIYSYLPVCVCVFSYITEFYSINKNSPESMMIINSNLYKYYSHSTKKVKNNKLNNNDNNKESRKFLFQRKNIKFRFFVVFQKKKNIHFFNSFLFIYKFPILHNNDFPYPKTRIFLSSKYTFSDSVES